MKFDHIVPESVGCCGLVCDIACNEVSPLSQLVHNNSDLGEWSRRLKGSSKVHDDDVPPLRGDVQRLQKPFTTIGRILVLLTRGAGSDIVLHILTRFGPIVDSCNLVVGLVEAKMSSSHCIIMIMQNVQPDTMKLWSTGPEVPVDWISVVQDAILYGKFVEKGRRYLQSKLIIYLTKVFVLGVAIFQALSKVCVGLNSSDMVAHWLDQLHSGKGALERGSALECTLPAL